MDVLIADPHILLSYIRNIEPWPKVMAEFCDNSFDRDAGGASSVIIELYRDRVIISDDGRGIDDINKLAQPGRSGSFYHAGNVGQYGLGSKCWMGKSLQLEVETVCNKVRHSFIFDARRNHRALKQDKPLQWLRAYSGKGESAAGKTFAKLTLLGLRKDSRPIIVDSLAQQLARIFWPGIRGGRSITIKDFRYAYREREVCVPELQPPKWINFLEFSGEISECKYQARAGILSETVGEFSGVWIGYLHRNIVIERSFVNRPMPTRLHIQVELSDDWRDCLSILKDRIVRYHDDLLDDIEHKCAELIKLAESETENIKLKQLGYKITGHLNRAIAKQRNKERRGIKIEVKLEPDKEVKEVKKPESPKQIDHKPAKGKIENGLTFGYESMGGDSESPLWNVSRSENSVRVIFNRDCPKLRALQDGAPAYPGLYLTIAGALFDEVLTMDVDEIERRFNGLLGSAKGSGIQLSYAKAIRAWIAFYSFEADREQHNEGHAPTEEK